MEKVHGGQVSFPGGKVEPDDANPTFTALRESEEELGILPSNVSVIGSLSPLYIPPSNFMVYPTVGFTPQRPQFIPSPDEVAAVIETDIDKLLLPQTPAKRKDKSPSAIGNRSSRFCSGRSCDMGSHCHDAQ